MKDVMNIGDRVRLIKGTEEGTVVGFLKNNLVEVEIEDGFKIPVLKNELAVVNALEQEYFGTKGTSQFSSPSPAPMRTSSTTLQKGWDQGLYLCFKEINDRLLSVYFYNQESCDILCSLSEQHDRHFKGIASFSLAPGKGIKLEDKSKEFFKEWKPYLVQVLFHYPHQDQFRSPWVKEIKWQASSLFKKKIDLPEPIGGKGFSLALSGKINTIDPVALKEKIESNVAPETKSFSSSPPLSKEIDLHAEALRLSSHVSEDQILPLQMQHFEAAFDQAIASGMEEVTFIHGIGNGVLRQNIHKYLSGHPHVNYFEDSQKGKFGYGATRVLIK